MDQTNMTQDEKYMKQPIKHRENHVQGDAGRTGSDLLLVLRGREESPGFSETLAGFGCPLC